MELGKGELACGQGLGIGVLRMGKGARVFRGVREGAAGKRRATRQGRAGTGRVNGFGDRAPPGRAEGVALGSWVSWGTSGVRRTGFSAGRH